MATDKKPLTKTELLANIAAATELTKTQVAAVLEALGTEIQKSLGSKGAGAITHPRSAEDREEEGSRPQGRKGRAEPLQARRTDGPPRQARLQQGQGTGVEDAQGHGKVAAMTKKDIVRRIADDLGRPEKEMASIVQKILATIVDVVAAEGRVEFRNFGVFEVRKRKPRQSRNPRTGEKVMVGERFTVKFKPGRVIKERVAMECGLGSVPAEGSQGSE